MAHRSRIAVLSRAAAVVFGDKEGSERESGWVKGQYRHLVGRRVTVCLNQALTVAERDLFFDNGGGEGYRARENGQLYTQEAIDAQRLLAETILEMHPELAQDGYSVTDPHGLIVAWNDNGNATEAEMEDLMWKTEGKAYEKWLAGRPADSQSFIDSITP